MVKGIRTVKVEPGSELDRLLNEAAGLPLLLEKDGVLYRLEKDGPEDIWAGYDPRKARRALDETTGSWADLDTDAVIAGIYRGRAEGSRPDDRP
jgi:hypothetical protein